MPLNLFKKLTKKIKTSSALKEQKGISQPEMTSQDSIDRIKKKRTNQISADALAHDILKGNITALSRGITLVESKNKDHLNEANALIMKCLPYANQSIRIGITGVPGVGKSTFIETFGNLLISLGRKVAVLAIDPSSSLSKGSILGDKTRMEDLVKQPNAFIRPSASGETLGGVARKTRESIILCEAAGFNIIIIETVGVGQSETAVHSMVDFFLLLKISGAGDELQGIKRGIMEMADAVVINKADGDNIQKAKMAQIEFNRALHLFPMKDSDWQPKVTTCSSLTLDGISEVYEIILDYISKTNQSGYFNSNREAQNQYWMMETINEQLKNSFYQHPEIIKELESVKKQVVQHKISPFLGAKHLLELFKK